VKLKLQKKKLKNLSNDLNALPKEMTRNVNGGVPPVIDETDGKSTNPVDPGLSV